ncbi:probable receptor-like protein kinase At1g80640 [Cornus florida]|uniref:probable receptor-like protein kinase At1g80640 n=1 Tax=Cornus florida TaxID=4283 RepID=UPI00289664AF|nr:probable receptor-like protein kinase At1g80640 [Cornus florida]
MNLLVLLIPIGVLSSILVSSPIEGRAVPPVSSISDPVLPTEKEEPISQISSDVEAQSPGVPKVKIVHHQEINKKIVVALIIAAALLGGIVLFLSCFWIYRLKHRKDSIVKNQQSPAFELGDIPNGLSLGPILGRFNTLRMSGKKGSIAVMDYPLLEEATNDFQDDNIIGEGRFGYVFKARIKDNFLAAVKRLNIEGQEADRVFANEVDWLSKIQHQNIVSLLGYCIHGKTRFMVYEMMQNGSLESQLHGPTLGSALTWHIRMKIALDVARGLEYLHERCNPTVIHRDLNSSNILLDSKFNAKLSDFGLAITGGNQNKNNIKLSGTLDDLAPEYLLDGKLTDKSDVYAFGVVLLELLLGKGPVEKLAPAQCQSIVTWAMPQLTDRTKLPDIIDPVIRNTMDLKHLYQVAAIAVLCVQQEPSYRPLITDVLHSFIPLVPVELGGSMRLAEPMAPASTGPVAANDAI